MNESSNNTIEEIERLKAEISDLKFSKLLLERELHPYMEKKKATKTLFYKISICYIIIILLFVVPFAVSECLGGSLENIIAAAFFAASIFSIYHLIKGSI